MNLYLNAGDNQITYNKKHYLLDAAQRMEMTNVLDMAQHKNEDFEYVLNIEPFERFVAGSKWTGIWEIDIMFDRAETNLSNWVACNTVFVANNNIPERMRCFQGDLVTLFQACDPLIHRRIPDIIPKYDFVLSGTGGLEIYEERSKAIKTLVGAGFTFADLGKGFPPREYAKKINEARVQFIRSAGKKPFTTQTEQRFFECLAIGPVLKDYHPDLELLGLVEGEDYFSYKSDEEMIAKMRILIDDPVFAKKMAEKGRQKAVTYHSYDARLGSIFANILKNDNHNNR